MRELLIGILNGAVGDYLARTGNGLATRMQVVGDVAPEGDRLVVLLHGLMNTEACFRFEDGSDYASMLERDLGYVPVRVRYNTGVPIAENGAHLDALMTDLVARRAQTPREIVLIGYSMGGLVVRAACDRGGAWVRYVKRCIYIGTPHLGAPAERLGKLASSAMRKIDDPYVQLVAQIAGLRSSGLQNLGDAHPLTLASSIEHDLVVGSVAMQPWLARLLGDSIVPIASASAGLIADIRHAHPAHVRLVPVHHVKLSRTPAVYEAIKEWCSDLG